MLLATIISVGVPVLVLVVIRWLQVYRTTATLAVIAMLAWGALCTRLAIPFNDRGVEAFGFDTTTVWIAPVVEETLKVLVLLALVRRRLFTWFLDGAVYGFAVGTGFAMVENLLYVQAGDSTTAVSTAVARVFSTALMHASASALVGAAIGAGKFSTPLRRGGLAIAGWGVAVIVHGGFNALVVEDRSVIGATALAIGALVVVVGVLVAGARRQRHWLVENLGTAQGVSVGEVRLVANMDDLAAALKAFTDRYGRADTDLAVELIGIQARLGLAVRAQGLAGDDGSYDADAVELRNRIDELRRRLGVFRMSHLRTLVGDRLDVEALATSWAMHAGLAARLGEDVERDEAAPAPVGGLWSSLAVRTERGEVPTMEAPERVDEEES